MSTPPLHRILPIPRLAVHNIYTTFITLNSDKMAEDVRDFAVSGFLNLVSKCQDYSVGISISTRAHNPPCFSLVRGLLRVDPAAHCCHRWRYGERAAADVGAQA